MISTVFRPFVFITVIFITQHSGHSVVGADKTQREGVYEGKDISKTDEISGQKLQEEFTCPQEVIESNQYILLPSNETFLIDGNESLAVDRNKSFDVDGNESLDVNVNETLVIFRNEIYRPQDYKLIGEKLCITKTETIQSRGKRILTCKKWAYDPDEFEILKNGSVLLYDEIINDYEIHGSLLYTCAPDEQNTSITVEQILIYIGRTGTVISVVALIIHLIVFGFVAGLRNLPGYNLASLSVAFLFAYFFILIGQIPEVLGTSCVVSAVLIHYFFLSAFFWMNVMSFDVWRALTLATKKLVSTSAKIRLGKLLCYTAYAWGVPMILTITSVVVDNTDGVPKSFKPGYGKDDICWINADSAKLLFFAGPAFLLFVINSLCFGASAYLILTNTMKEPGDHHRVAKRNFILYIRLGVMMGVTWMFGVISALAKYEVLWFIFDIFNSLQGLFVFLFFPCSKKCWQLLRRIEIENTKSTTIQNTSSA